MLKTRHCGEPFDGEEKILLNAFNMNCIGHINHGLWTHPRDTSTQYKTIEYWTELAQTLERGLFDGLFIADIVGVYDVYQNSIDVPLKESIQLPVNDPLLLVSAMAAVTRNLGFGLTANLTLRAAVPVRPTHVHARSPEPWPGGLEHRHRLPRQRRQSHGPERAGRA